MRKGDGDDKGTVEMSGRVGAHDLLLLRRPCALHLDSTLFAATNVLHERD